MDDIISRDINRTFPEHPQFGFEQGQQALFRVLKAYSLHDLEVCNRPFTFRESQRGSIDTMATLTLAVTHMHFICANCTYRLSSVCSCWTAGLLPDFESVKGVLQNQSSYTDLKELHI